MEILACLSTATHPPWPSWLFRSVGAGQLDKSAAAVVYNAHQPRVAADLAILHETAVDVRFHVDLNLLAAKRAGDLERVVHGASL